MTFIEDKHIYVTRQIYIMLHVCSLLPLRTDTFHIMCFINQAHEQINCPKYQLVENAGMISLIEQRVHKHVY